MAKPDAITGFAHLHLHTEYSLLDGGNKISALMKRVKELGMNAVAITDHGNLHGAVEFYTKARDAGIRPILGIEAYVAQGDRTERKTTGIADGGFHLVLLAENETGWRRRFGLFGHAPFSVYWFGGLVSNTGTWLQAVAASVFVYQLTGSVFMVGVLNFVSFLPIVLFSVYGGSLADRRDRRLIVITTSLVAGSIAFGLALLTLYGRADVLIVIVAGFLMNSVYAVTKPSVTALLPDLVPPARLDEAVSLNTLQFILGQLLGPLLAALILVVLGPGEAFLINGFTFIALIASMTYLMRHGLGATPARSQGRHRAAAIDDDGNPVSTPDAPERVTALGVFSYIRDHMWIGYMLVTVICASAAMEVARTLAPALAAEQLGIAESGAGIIIAAQSFGSAIGVLAFVGLRRRGPSVIVATVGMSIQAVGLLSLTVAGDLFMASLSVALVGAGFSLSFPVPTSALQKEVDAGYRGRVMSVHQVAHLGNRPFSALAIGALAAGFGLPIAAFVAVGLAPIGVLALRRGWRSRPSAEADVTPDPVPA